MKRSFKPTALNQLHKLAVVIFLILFSTSLPAALVSVDWKTPGDKLLVRDSATSLKWLKLTETAELSYNLVSSQFGTGGEFEGMRYATSTEVTQLFGTNFDLDLSTGAPEVISESDETGIDDKVLNAAETMGNIFELLNPFDYPDTPYGVLGITADVWFDTSVPPSHERMGAYHNTYGDYNNFNTETYTYQWDTNAQPFYGSYLVSSVPLPAGVWLFGSGLLFLSTLARRNTRN